VAPLSIASLFAVLGARVRFVHHRQHCLGATVGTVVRPEPLHQLLIAA